MSKFDYTLFASTQDNPGGAVIQYLDDEPMTIELPLDSAGSPTREGVVGYGIAYILLFVAAAYFLLI